MPEFFYEIADISFLTNLNFEIPRTSERAFEPFIISKNHSIKVKNYITKIEAPHEIEKTKELLKLVAPSLLLEKQIVAADPHFNPRCFFREIRNNYLEHNNVLIINENDFLRIFDFSKKTLNIFVYTDYIKSKNECCKSEHFIAANLRIIYSSFLTSFSSIILHCAGLVLDQGSAIFFAPNYGGKTTLISLSKNRFPILNDDQVILKKENSGIFAHSTPFGAQNSGPIKAKLKAIFFLIKSTSFKIEPISPLDIINCLWGEHLRYTNFLPKSSKFVAFNILFDALHQAPTYKLYFQKDFIDWNAIKSSLIPN